MEEIIEVASDIAAAWLPGDKKEKSTKEKERTKEKDNLEDGE